MSVVMANAGSMSVDSAILARTVGAKNGENLASVPCLLM